MSAIHSAIVFCAICHVYFEENIKLRKSYHYVILFSYTKCLLSVEYGVL